MRKSPTRFIRRVNNKFTSASLDLNFQNMTTSGFDSRITFTRASSGTFFNGSGILQTASTNVPRLDHSPTTLQSLGLLIEEQRTNSIRNNTMQGAVAGTPGTLPTNWVVTSTANGITREIVGTGVENGVTYIDVKYSGTPTTNVFLVVNTESNSQIVAANGQSWAASWFVKLIGGSISNVGVVRINVSGYTSAGVGVSGQTGIIDIQTLISTNPLQTQRYTATTNFSSASVERVNTNITMTTTTGSPIDITLRIGLPQLEQGAFATSVIPTTVAAATRNADVASMTGTNFSSWYNATEGTLYADWNTFSAIGQGLPYAVGFTDNDASSSSAQLVIQARTLNNQIRVWQSTSGGGLDDFVTLTVTTVNGKAAINYGGLSNVSGSANGGSVSTVGAAIQTTAFNALTIGRAAGPITGLNGHIRRIAYYPVRLSNDQLQALTR